MAKSYIGIGANLGEPLCNCRRAVQLLAQEEGLEVVQRSSLYKTEPIGYTNQPWFINGVVALEGSLSPRELLRRLQAIERLLGRERETRWGPRTIDLDLLSYEDWILQEEGLVIPHPRIAERRFVLVPLAEIVPDWRHPQSQRTIQELLQTAGGGQVIRIPDAWGT
ncbi:MAG: 2-amino-4-hydroxy-6-hydroxymethyldihydropteridine diphosphokinase [Candidatus Tectomicrobia bacterium]|uniref:2-amino-4-hydroxy-6-hydroxymethyldihydropteridine pyrophosphokinase n=1 Tax=Tectimicrobiota bacterium TaxID=2528274 RepID=A0A932FY11_UNCTE|nr:2-amino-4-hydroxy-6-hydroxymethyldihydropteridine diphosphokinase [Candidatus Tectomicrobia bacterium]